MIWGVTDSVGTSLLSSGYISVTCRVILTDSIILAVEVTNSCEDRTIHHINIYFVKCLQFHQINFHFSLYHRMFPITGNEICLVILVNNLTFDKTKVSIYHYNDGEDKAEQWLRQICFCCVHHSFLIHLLFLKIFINQRWVNYLLFCMLRQKNKVMKLE